MIHLKFLLPLVLLAGIASLDAAEPPAKALKYHQALTKRPSNETLFDRFFGAWIDEQDIASLEKFLTSRAKENGGPDLSILARYQLRRGNEGQALEVLGQAIAAQPKDFSLPMERAKILLRRLDFENAREDLKTVAEGATDNSSLEASKLIGRSWLREGKTEKAIAVWDAILAENPGDEDLMEDLVESAATEGETDQALVYIDKLIAASSDAYKKTLRELRRGDLLAQAGRNDDALSTYSATLENVGEGSWLEREILAQIDKSFRKQDRIDDLKNKLIELAEANPRRLLIHRQIAQIEAAQGDTDAAVGRFREVLKRSPGNRELREEFVRLLTDGEKYVEAAEELEKLIKIAPDDAGLFLQMADLRNREENTEATLAALKEARKLLGSDEASGIRIAGLMFQYELQNEGEKLLKDLSSEEGSTVAPSEALAAEYARTNRKPEALELLKTIGNSDNLDTVLRAAASISAIAETETALNILSAKSEDFGNEPRFLASIAQAALAAKKPEIAVENAVKLVRITNPAADLSKSIGLALRSIAAADQSTQWRETLEKQQERSTPETCLLAALADSQADFDAVSKIMTGASDPNAIRFHAAILDRRGELDKAITVLSSLAETDEGRKTSYFKDMTDLQRRAGKIDDALATIERWKQSAPGDKTSWVTQGSVLREQGRPEEAVKVARQAVARFGEDPNLAATLASLHQEAGQMRDAEAIYWRLYDESESPSDQIRWAAQLAKLSQQTGRTEDLEEKLRERAKNNRRSIAPILAQAELARVTRNEEKRRDLLLDAVRLQPKDIDLRLQIANLEEQSGNPDRVIAILEEAAAVDASGRVRSALAQAYLRQGQTIKGMREMRKIAGKKSDDPRSIERSAATLAGSGLYEEAILFLREVLPEGGDWRTQYLLAIMLEHDGRETEAIPIFQALLQASGEVEGLTKQSTSPYYRPAEYEPEVRKIFELMMSGQAAYAHSNPNSRGGYYGQTSAAVGPFILPQSPEAVQTLSRIHLAKLKAGNIENADFITELIAVNPMQPDFPALLKKYPNQPGLLEIILLYAGQNRRNSPVDHDMIREALSKKEKISPSNRFRADLIMATAPGASEKEWQTLTLSTKKAVETADPKSNNFVQIAYQLFQILAEGGPEIPEAQKTELTETLLKIANNEELNRNQFAGFRLMVISALGTTEEWIEAANQEVANFQKEDSSSQQSNTVNYRSYRMSVNPFMNRSNPFSLPSLESLQLKSLPTQVMGMIQKPNQQRNYYGSGNNAVDSKELVKQIDRIESPVLKAYVAILAEDEEAASKALSTEPSKKERADINALRGLKAIEKKDYVAAYGYFEKLRSAHSSNRQFAAALNYNLLAIASEMTEEERVKRSEELRALLLQARRTGGTKGAPMLASQAEKLGFPKLAKRFQPTTLKATAGITNRGGATFGTKSSRSSSSGGNATIEKMKKFALAGKHEAAALEALNLIRAANANQYNRSYQMREIREAITPETTKELFKLADPGESKSLTKLKEYADISLEFGKEDRALEILQRLHKRRPDDAVVAGKLAFLLPKEQREKSIELIATAASDPGFVQLAAMAAQNLAADENNERTLAFFSIVADWLSEADPEALKSTNLTWITYNAKEFFDGDYTRNLQALDDTPKQDFKPSEEYKSLVSIAERLALAMIRFDSIAEEGFRLLRFSKAWEIDAETMDTHARTVLMAAPATLGSQFNYHSFFSLRTGNGSSSSGDSLEELSSIGWIGDRLAVEKSEKILPPEFLKELSEKDADLGRVVSALANTSNLEDVRELWSSNALQKISGPFGKMLNSAVLNRASTVEGVDRFFLEEVEKIKPGWVMQRGQGSYEASLNLLIATLKSASAGNAKSLSEACKAISKAVLGDNFDIKDLNDNMRGYQALNVMENLLQEANLNPITAVRVYNTFYKLGIPVGSEEYSVLQPFRQELISNKEAAVKAFGSYGWLNDTENWKPFAAIFVKAEYNGGQPSFSREETFLVPKALSYMNLSVSRSDLRKHLENHKPATFGSLITAASLSSGTDRTKLTGKAFALAAPKIINMPPERIEAFSVVVSWLSPEELAKLPPVFRKKAETANAARLEKLRDTADSFMRNNMNANRHGRSLFSSARTLIEQLAPLDLDKSVELFLAVERHFTEGLDRGGRLSSYTSNGLQIIERDEAMSRILNSSESTMRANPSVALQFLSAVNSKPEAQRFSFADSGRPLFFQVGQSIYEQTSSASKNKEPKWLLASRSIAEMPESIRQDASYALAAYVIGNSSLANRVRLPSDRDALKKIKNLSKELIDLRSFSIGVSGWDKDTPEGRLTTSKLFASIASNSTVAEVTRFQLLAIAIHARPRMLDNPTIGEVFATSFENYASKERSVVNSLGFYPAISIGKISPTETNKPFIQRINKAFWDNANASKPGGHPQIPPAFGDELFLAAAKSGDTKTANKLLSAAKTTIEGDTPLIASLISSGQHELAKKLLPNPNKALKNAPSAQAYTKDFEKHLEEFRETAGFDPVSLLYLEAKLMNAPHASDSKQPSESELEREKRLAAAYKANPPTTTLLRTEILSSLIRDSHKAAILLRDEVIALSEELDLDRALQDWHKGTHNGTDPTPRYYLAPAECVIIRQAAFLRFLDGDVSGLKKLAKIAGQQSLKREYHQNGTRDAVESFLARVNISAPLWICEAIHLNKTEGFKDAFEPFATLAIVADKREEFDTWNQCMPLAIAEFFAYWNSDGNQFEELRKKIKRNAKSLAYFKERWSILQLTKIGSKHRMWKREIFAESLNDFLITVFTRKEMDPYFGHIQRWITLTAKDAKLRSELLAISKNPPENTAPSVLPQLLSFRSKHELENKQFDAGIASARAAVAACPDQGKWKDVRFRMRLPIVEKLIAAKKIDLANEVYSEFITEDFNENQKKRYKELGQKLKR
ncbi:MAG: tetratricopeptide repeat protein [Akkermansiaceae bacterium]